MKFLALCLLFATTLFADNLTLQNETTYPKVAVQWASSARMVQEQNDSIIQQDPLPQSDLSYAKQSKASFSIPKNATYFRVLIWDSAQNLPDFLTNWVEIVPEKTYLLKQEHLTPLLLITGMGC